MIVGTNTCSWSRLVLPKYLNSERIVRIIGEDDNEEMVTINGEEKNEQNEAIGRLNDITIGRYDVTVTVGPSYTTKRLESAESMISFVQAVPQAGQAIMDLLAKSMDWPGADAIAERLRKLVPPQLLEGEEGEETIKPEQVEAMIQQATQQLEQQFMASLEERDMQVKEYEAETDRIAKTVPKEEELREMVGTMLAEFLQELNTGAITAP